MDSSGSSSGSGSGWQGLRLKLRNWLAGLVPRKEDVRGLLLLRWVSLAVANLADPSCLLCPFVARGRPPMLILSCSGVRCRAGGSVELAVHTRPLPRAFKLFCQYRSSLYNADDLSTHPLLSTIIAGARDSLQRSRGIHVNDST
jgi:hypothetical protein